MHAAIIVALSTALQANPCAVSEPTASAIAAEFSDYLPDAHLEIAASPLPVCGLSIVGVKDTTGHSYQFVFEHSGRDVLAVYEFDTEQRSFALLATDSKILETVPRAHLRRFDRSLARL